MDHDDGADEDRGGGKAGQSIHQQALRGLFDAADDGAHAGQQLGETDEQGDGDGQTQHLGRCAGHDELADAVADEYGGERYADEPMGIHSSLLRVDFLSLSKHRT